MIWLRRGGGVFGGRRRRGLGVLVRCPWTVVMVGIDGIEGGWGMGDIRRLLEDKRIDIDNGLGCGDLDL